MSTAHLHAVRDSENLVELYAEAPLPTRHGLLRAMVFREKATGKEHVLAVKGELRGQEGVPVRIHSECLTSEILGSLKCDCREQLEHALDLIGRSERGAVVYLRQEGRGAIEKLLLASGAELDTETRETPARVAKAFIEDLLTNNPKKIEGLQAGGITVRRRIASLAPSNPHNVGYLRTKRERSGHLIELTDQKSAS